MAQAEIRDTPTSRRVEGGDRSFYLECDINNLAVMARVAELTLHDTIGETEFEGDQVVRHHLTSESIGRAVFVVSHLAEMIEALQAKISGASNRTEH